MYTVINFKTKKELKAALANGEKIEVYQPNALGNPTPKEGKVYLEGPHFPKPHTWYAEAWLKDGYIERIK